MQKQIFPPRNYGKQPVGIEPTHPRWERERLPLHHGCIKYQERLAGIEPAFPAWQADVIPLYHSRI